MGANPSHFKGADRPVEQVSWDDVQAFLRKLEALVPGIMADLPTEAEWEYACRAGTTTPFSFGSMITPEQVNYDGNLPYAGGEKGIYREETVPAKSLPPNPWGLYEMHGNVWEWCADGMRDYNEGPALDPRGPELSGAEAHRASPWRLLARPRRVGAVRLPPRVSPGPALRILGFRLCLRSIGSGQGRPGGPAGRTPGGRPGAPPRPEAEPRAQIGPFSLAVAATRNSQKVIEAPSELSG